MLQCGLTIPLGEGSETGIFKNILIDIGDEQSIDNDLSTYSSHLINMKYFVKNGGDKTLILIDEFGTGTEPMLGGSIAEAILGELNRKKVFGVITTHYTNLKHFASLTEGIVNGAMAFDNHLMQPLFQLTIGKPGSSFAFEIARKIGLPEDILEELMAEYEKELSGAKTLRKEIITKAKDEAQQLLKESNRMIETTIRQIKESQAEKEKTKDVRQQLEEFKSVVEEESKPIETESEEKIAQLVTRAKRIKLEPEPVREKPVVTASKDHPLKPGDAVRMIDTQAAGEIIEIKD